MHLIPQVFSVKVLPGEEDIRAYEYKAEDLEEAVTNCASPSLTLPFLPDTNIVVSKTEGPKIDEILRIEAEATIVIDEPSAGATVHTCWGNCFKEFCGIST
jgi:hypothetical protein